MKIPEWMTVKPHAKYAVSINCNRAA